MCKTLLVRWNQYLFAVPVYCSSGVIESSAAYLVSLATFFSNWLGCVWLPGLSGMGSGLRDFLMFNRFFTCCCKSATLNTLVWPNDQKCDTWERFFELKYQGRRSYGLFHGRLFKSLNGWLTRWLSLNDWSCLHAAVWESKVLILPSLAGERSTCILNINYKAEIARTWMIGTVHSNANNFYFRLTLLFIISDKFPQCASTRS